MRVDEHCPCKHHRLLASYEPGSSTVDMLAGNAAIEMTMPVHVGATITPEGVVYAQPLEGSATCERRICKLLKRC